jgi:hypothetical protein
MGQTIGDFYNAWQRPANLQVALQVRARAFVDLFVARMEAWVRSIHAAIV